VVILPEMFNTGFTMNTLEMAETMDGETIHWMKELAITKKIILTGSIIIAEDGKYYNRLIWMQPNGEMHHYDKRHCFGLAGEQEHFTSGNKKIIVQANGIKICLQICYDLRFPVFSRQIKNNEYDVLLYVANWPHKRAYAWQHLLIARAIENQCYVIGVNRIGTDANNLLYNGNSTIINAMGEPIYTALNHEETATTIIDTKHVQDTRNALPFLKDADDFRMEM
jgi:omega-amidase